MSVDPTWKIGIVASSFYKEEMKTLVLSGSPDNPYWIVRWQFEDQQIGIMIDAITTEILKVEV